jgi:hypothetical protein
MLAGWRDEILERIKAVAGQCEPEGGKICAGAAPPEDSLMRLDWETFMAGLSEQDQAVIQFIVEGNW